MRSLRVALAQINTTVGDLPGNAAKVIDWVGRARALGADVVAFPELALTGYPPEDLVLRRSFVEDNLRALEEVAAAATDIVAVVGFVDLADDVYDAAAVCAGGASRTSITSSSCRTTACSTKTATSSAAASRRCSASPASRWG